MYVSGALLRWGCGGAEHGVSFPQGKTQCFCCVLAACRGSESVTCVRVVFFFICFPRLTEAL